eukprot:11222187-Lingulodinium_polyedra.AAC.1
MVAVPELYRHDTPNQKQMFYQTARSRTHNAHKTRALIREQKPTRFITYCTRAHCRDYRLMMRMRMYQAAENR